MSDHPIAGESREPHEATLSISHLANTIRAYASVVLLTMAAVAALSIIVAIGMFLAAPSQRSTTQPFRLNFQGAAEGRFPNGRKFSPADVISVPILLRVFSANHLERFTTFPNFSNSVVILESNRAYEKLASEYQARLSDPKLSPIDRDRIEKEYELKRASLNKDEYAIGYYPFEESRTIPTDLVRKVLVDILSGWADAAVHEQQVLSYRVAVFSPTFIDESALEQSDYVVATQILRTKVSRVLDNVGALKELPGAETARTKVNAVSLEEIRLRLEDILRFRVEPLVGVIRSSGLVTNAAVTTHFLESQLSYDQRQLKALQETAESFRQTLGVYAMDAAPTGDTRPATAKSPAQAAGSETVMPQFTDTFLDRLVALTSHSENEQYRQAMASRYLEATQRIIPAMQSVQYDQQVLEQIRSGSGSAGTLPPAAIHAQLDQTRSDVRELIVRTNDIYQLLSRNMNPSTELFALAGSPVSRTARSRDLGRLALYALFITLLSGPIAILFCLLHNRLREEEDDEAQHNSQQTAPQP